MPPKPPGGKYAVQIAARNSEAEARALIDDMRAKYPRAAGAAMGGRSNASPADKASAYRVMVGPLATRGQAAKLCADLKAKAPSAF